MVKDGKEGIKIKGKRSLFFKRGLLVICITLAALMGASFVQAADLMSFTANVKDSSGSLMNSGGNRIDRSTRFIGNLKGAV